MSQPNTFDERTDSDRSLWAALVALLGILGMVVVVALFILAAGSPLGSVVDRLFNALFAANSVQALWYVTRAAGITAYLLLWLSTAWGLAVSSKVLDWALHRTFTYDFHQFLSLLAIGFIALHVVVLTADRYLPYSVAEIVVPFLSPYRPLWVGIGVIGLYLTLLVTITFYIRRWIGVKAFRVIHLASFAAYFFALIHGVYAGTDSPLWTTELMYAGTFLVVVFLSVYWLVTALASRSAQPQTNRNNFSRIPKFEEGQR
ncbi:MAG: ferric reductase-like transmembrane domain-containing protein [Chloroflexota bacterium]|nr:ferric reductase-like transmembrane domain-containing protein [Chloroflexota bacterium]